jgi:hypothetical protein
MSSSSGALRLFSFQGSIALLFTQIKKQAVKFARFNISP